MRLVSARHWVTAEHQHRGIREKQSARVVEAREGSRSRRTEGVRIWIVEVCIQTCRRCILIVRRAINRQYFSVRKDDCVHLYARLRHGWAIYPLWLTYPQIYDFGRSGSRISTSHNYHAWIIVRWGQWQKHRRPIGPCTAVIGVRHTGCPRLCRRVEDCRTRRPPGVKHISVRQQVHPRIKGGRPSRCVRLAPTDTNLIDLNRRICVAVLVQTREHHYAAVAQRRGGRIPATVCHRLKFDEIPSREVIS